MPRTPRGPSSVTVALWVKTVVDILLGKCWAPSRKARNRRVHALHGNGPGKGGNRTGSQASPGAGWATVGGQSKLPEAKMLKEPTPARRLREAGWELPKEVTDEVLVRVYDTRLDPRWVQEVVHEMCLPHKTYLVGGDFMMPAYLGLIRRRGWSGRMGS